MGFSSELSCEAGSFSHCRNPHGFLQPEGLRLSFPMLEPWDVQSVLLPSFSSQFIHTQMWDCQPWRCHASFLPISALPTSLDGCFFFDSLGVGLLSIQFIFWHFLFLFLNLLLSFFWLYEEAKCICLRLHLCWECLYFLS